MWQETFLLMAVCLVQVRQPARTSSLQNGKRTITLRVTPTTATFMNRIVSLVLLLLTSCALAYAQPTTTGNVRTPTKSKLNPRNCGLPFTTFDDALWLTDIHFCFSTKPLVVKIAAAWTWDSSTPVPMASFALSDFTSQLTVSYSSNSTKNVPNQAQLTITAPAKKFDIDIIMCTCPEGPPAERCSQTFGSAYLALKMHLYAPNPVETIVETLTNNTHC